MAVLVLALGLPGLAAAEEFRDSPAGLEVRGDDGTVLSRVESVERDRNGRIISVEAPGLEPADAPSDVVMAENNAHNFFVNYPVSERADRERAAGGRSTSAR